MQNIWGHQHLQDSVIICRAQICCTSGNFLYRVNVNGTSTAECPGINGFKDRSRSCAWSCSIWSFTQPCHAGAMSILRIHKYHRDLPVQCAKYTTACYNGTGQQCSILSKLKCGRIIEMVNYWKEIEERLHTLLNALGVWCTYCQACFDAAIPDLMSHGSRPVHWSRDVGILPCKLVLPL